LPPMPSDSVAPAKSGAPPLKRFPLPVKKPEAPAQNPTFVSPIRDPGF